MYVNRDSLIRISFYVGAHRFQLFSIMDITILDSE